MASGLSVQWDGVADMQRALEALGRSGKVASGAALYQEAELIMTDAKQRTPVDIGTLRNSGFVKPPQVTSDFDVTVTLGFGGAAEDYAIVQHEDLSLHHTVGEAKFLEKAMLAAARGLPERLARTLRRFLERG